VTKKVRTIINGATTNDGDKVSFTKEGSRYLHNLLSGDFIYIPEIGLYEVKSISKNYVEFNSNIKLLNPLTDKVYFTTLLIKALNKSRISLKLLQDLDATIDYCAHKPRSNKNSGGIETYSNGSIIQTNV
jgi:hypothetical protein